MRLWKERVKQVSNLWKEWSKSSYALKQGSSNKSLFQGNVNLFHCIRNFKTILKYFMREIEAVQYKVTDVAIETTLTTVVKREESFILPQVGKVLLFTLFWKDPGTLILNIEKRRRIWRRIWITRRRWRRIELQDTYALWYCRYICKLHVTYSVADVRYSGPCL